MWTHTTYRELPTDSYSINNTVQVGWVVGGIFHATRNRPVEVPAPMKNPICYFQGCGRNSPGRDSIY